MAQRRGGMRSDSRLACLAALFLVLGQKAHAQELAFSREPHQAAPLIGHSAAYFGVEPARRSASIQAYLAPASLDRSQLQRGLIAESASFMLTLFLGGAEPPGDLATPRPNIAQVLGKSDTLNDLSEHQ